MPQDLANSPGMSPDAAADAVFEGAGAGLFESADDITDDVGRSAEEGAKQPEQTTRSGKRISQRSAVEADDEDASEPQEVSDSLVEDEEAEQASDEDDDQSEDEAKAAEDGDDDEEGEGEEAGGDLVEVTIDGETREVPIEELAEAYTAKQKGELDYESRVNELNVQAQNVVSQYVQQVSSTRQQLVQQLQELQQYQQSNMPQPPDPALADPSSPNYDPDKYTQQQALYQKAANENQAIQHHIQQHQEQMQQEQQMVMEQVRAAQRGELLQKWPEWNDSGVRQQFLSDVQKHYGFSDEEVASIMDHRFYLLARDAIEARKAQQAAEKKPVKRAKKSAKSAGKAADQARSKGQKAKTSRKDALARVRKSGRLGDIAAAFEDHLPDDIF